MAGETVKAHMEEAHVEQVAPEDQEAHEEAPLEQEGSSSKDGDEEGVQ
jgi:hypothetical protein